MEKASTMTQQLDAYFAKTRDIKSVDDLLKNYKLENIGWRASSYTKNYYVLSYIKTVGLKEFEVLASVLLKTFNAKFHNFHAQIVGIYRAPIFIPALVLATDEKSLSSGIDKAYTNLVEGKY